jgi:hypothetical protein
MQKKIDIKSMVLGAALGAVIMLSVAATHSSSGGRYQLVAADSYLFKIDTTTGQIWSTLSSLSREFMAANAEK